MIRTARISPTAASWPLSHDARVTIGPATLAVARLEPILRALLGQAQLDLVFDDGERMAVVTGILVDCDQLLTRERRALVWPARLAAAIAPHTLDAVEAQLGPWLHAISRGRPLCDETIRRFRPCPVFERLRVRGYPGAAPLERSLVLTAPYAYARQHAAGKHVRIEGDDPLAGWAMLADVAAGIEVVTSRSETAADAARWFGWPGNGDTRRADLTIEPDPGDMSRVRVIVNGPAGRLHRVGVPQPVPWDVMHAIDAADGEIVATFGVCVPEPHLRDVARACDARAGSPVARIEGRIAVAVSAEAWHMRSGDAADAAALAGGLPAAGWAATIVTDPGDPALTAADLVHIIGQPEDPALAAFAQRAHAVQRPYVLDLPPYADDVHAYAEIMFGVLCRSALDDTDLAGFMPAYNAGKLAAANTRLVPLEVATAARARFAAWCTDAHAIFTERPGDPGWHALAPGIFAGKAHARGGLWTDAEPGEPIGHLVPSRPFALVTGTIGCESHGVFVCRALAAADLPLVVAGPVYDVEALQTVRLVAPHAAIIGDPSAGVMWSLMRAARWWVDASPRPRSVSALAAALRCGALPVVGRRSPLAALCGPAAVTFADEDLERSIADLRALAAAGTETETARVGALCDGMQDLLDPAAAVERIARVYRTAFVSA